MAQMPERFLGGRIVLHAGDCRAVLAELPENSIDSCVCDPPYHLTSIVKRFANATLEHEVFAANNPTPAYGRLSRGFMGKQWDGGNGAFEPETWRAVIRVLKPGGYLLAMGGTRTYHRMACAIEDAGFDVRDLIAWCYGSGFPKSHDVSKGIDRAAGAEREKLITGAPVKRMIPGADQNKAGWEKNNGREYIPGIEIPATAAARQWDGWGTALKPALEPICMARKPLSEDTVAANVLRWGTGAINVDGCRVGTDQITTWATKNGDSIFGQVVKTGEDKCPTISHGGRWPANLVHDGSEEVVAGFPETTVAGSNDKRGGCNFFHGGERREAPAGLAQTESGSAARFFYTAKADSDDRLGSKHPTVKPLDLMQWLVRLVTPEGGTVLDPFAGTGTTGEAAFRELMSAVLIEAEPEYLEDIRCRVRLVLAGPLERQVESIKARGLPEELGPLFEWRRE